MTEEPLSLNESQGTLFSLGQITLAVFLGSPIAGCLLLAQNYRTLGKNESALQSVLIGILLTLAVFFAAYLLPDSFPNTVLPVAYTIGMREGIKYLQGDVITRYVGAGKKGSWTVATLVGLACLILLSIFIVGLILCS